MIAAASGLSAETISVTTRTAVVTQAANLGPRTSTRSSSALVLVLDTNDSYLPVARKGGDMPRRDSGLLGVLRARARLLSSYSNSNNNNPRCGTDRLRDAW